MSNQLSLEHRGEGCCQTLGGGWLAGRVPNWGRFVVALLAWSIVDLWGGASVVAQDTVTLHRRVRGGSKVIGKITSVTATEVTVEATGKEEKRIPANQIQRLGLDDEPNELREARSDALSGQWEQAWEVLKAIDLPGDARPVLRQELGYYRAMVRAELALRGAVPAAEALSTMKEFLRAEKDSFHFYPAVELLGELAESTGAYEDAAKFYQQLRKAPWPEYQMRTAVLLGRALQSQGKYDEAVAQYEQAMKANGADAEAARQQVLARLGRAACWAEQGKTDDAIRDLEEVIEKNDPADQELFAQAYLALGSAHAKAQRPLEATLAYLHVDLLFYGQRDAHAQALYQLTVLWPLLDQPDRAVEARKLLNTRYPGSIWSKKAG